MNDSSAQESYLTTLSDEQISAISSISAQDTITISSDYTNSSASTITLTIPPSISTSGAGGISYVTGAGLSGMTVGGISGSSINWTYNQEEFVNCLPDFSRIQAMCKEYPGLKIAYEKFVTTYRLVKDDYDTPKDQRPLP